MPSPLQQALLMVGGNIPFLAWDATTTWNPADLLNVTLTLGNLRATASAAGGVRAITSRTTGKYYFEITFTTIGSNPSMGIALASANLTGSPGTGIASVIRFTGAITVNGSASGSNIAIIGSAAVVGVAVNLTTDLIWFKNITAAGNWNGNPAANPTTGAGGISIASIHSAPLLPIFFGTNLDAMTANFGGTAFAGALP